VGEEMTLEFTFEYDELTGLSRLTLNGVVNEWINFGELVTYFYSLFNTHTVDMGFSRQFLGTIRSFGLIDTRNKLVHQGDIMATGGVIAETVTTNRVVMADASGNATGGGIVAHPVYGTNITGMVTGDQAQLRIQDGNGNEAMRLLGGGFTAMSGTFLFNSFSNDGSGAAQQFSYGASINLLKLKAHELGSIVADATTPVPYTGSSTLAAYGGNLFFWDGTRWKQIAFTTNT
jgi:hypothetical protein